MDFNLGAVRLPLPVFVIAWLLLAWLLRVIIAALKKRQPIAFKKFENYHHAISYGLAFFATDHAYMVHWHPGASWFGGGPLAYLLTEERYCSYKYTMRNTPLSQDETIGLVANLTALAVSIAIIIAYLSLLARNLTVSQLSPLEEKRQRIFKISGCCFLLVFFFYVTLINRQAVDCMASYINQRLS